MIDPQRLDGDAWYAVHCQPFKERLAASLLADLGLTVYLPEIKHRLHGQTRYMPFFLRYLFVRADLRTVAANRINAIAGVLRLVSFGATPQPISPSVIETLRLRVDHFNAQGGLLNHRFRPGDMVRLNDGPLQGLEAIFVGPMRASERVRVLIEFLGGRRAADVRADALECVTAPLMPVIGPPRRTRGKGRRINLH
ncbi:MAG TPA: transcription termination/antitermination NusG family protein [Roseiflexaceae bacterium]|jgi:transcriptional antiterminator RfaH